MDEMKWNPGTLMAMSGYYWKTCTLHAAVKLDVFTVIGEACLTAGEISEALQADERALTMLLNALAAMELLVKTDAGYANSSAGRLFLSKDAPGYIGYMIKHHQNLVDSWMRLDEAIIKGVPLRARGLSRSDEERESFLMGMFNTAMGLAPGLAKEIDLKGRIHLLDLGGGPGTYAIHFCMENPHLDAAVYDLPTTRPFAEKTIERFGLTDRVRFVPGNFLEDPIQGRFDVAWLSHILHGEGPEDCTRILRKTVEALEAGGLLLIHDFILNDSMDGPLFPALFSMNMLLGSWCDRMMIALFSEVWMP